MKNILWTNDKKGFTLAEVMMAVAIIAILAGVSFIGVTGYLRSMALLERDGIAKEIFVAAQNHLTMAKGQGYLGLDSTSYGNEDESADGSYYLTVNESADLTGDTMAKVMLPLGAVDETIRTAGSYIIRYNPEQALVQDVFYCSRNGSRYDGKLDDLSDIGDEYEEKSYRKNFDSDSVLGWFGGEDAQSLDTESIASPALKLVNDDVLYAEVTTNNTDSDNKLQVYLYVEGLTSGASGYFILNGADSSASTSYKIVLDDITTADRHFSQIYSFEENETAFKSDSTNDTAVFIPGEDIRVYATVFNNSTLSQIAKSSLKTTNSLFADVEEVEEDSTTTYTQVSVSSMRHLENLYDNNSGMFYSSLDEDGSFQLDAIVENSTEVKAVQTDNLDWAEFINSVKKLNSVETVTVYINSGDTFDVDNFSNSNATSSGCYLPISPSYELEYDGDGYSISNVEVNYDGDAGLIGTLTAGSISNLQLIDFSITSSDGNAGALAGTLNKTSDLYHGTTVTNVLAYNSESYTATENITAQDGDAGGLIGKLYGSNSGSELDSYGGLSACTAALYVTGSGNAGGLIGTIDGSTYIEGCYTGGHIISGSGRYSQNADASSATSGGLINVIGTGNVGGLIGDAGSSTILYSYSTCSAYGTASTSYVGGLVGQASGTISDCYSTGWVSGSADISSETEETESGSEEQTESGTTSSSTIEVLDQIGAFAGALSGSATDCYYFIIINERYNESDGYTYLSPVGGSETTTGISAFDDTPTTYQNFVTWSDSSSADAVPYDELLADYYKNDDDECKYSLTSVEQLGFSVSSDSSSEDDGAEDYYIQTHYGDWPMPDVITMNTTS